MFHKCGTLNVPRKIDFCVLVYYAIRLYCIANLLSINNLQGVKGFPDAPESGAVRP